MLDVFVPGHLLDLNVISSSNFSSLDGLHSRDFVHADLKPGNVMWSGVDGCFKLLDFSLTFHAEERELHQIQTKGYQAPEAAEWNRYKEELKKRRKRKLQGTYTDLTKVAPAFRDSINQICEDDTKDDSRGDLVTSTTTAAKERWPSESSGVFTASEMSQCTSPTNMGEQSPNKARYEKCTSQKVIRVNVICGQSLFSTSDLSNCSDNTPKHSIANVSSSDPSRRRHSLIATTATPMRPICTAVPESGVGNGGGGAEWRRAGGGRKAQKLSTMTTVLPPAPALPTAAIDIWSFGCLLYETLSGSKLFRCVRPVIKAHERVCMLVSYFQGRRPSCQRPPSPPAPRDAYRRVRDALQ